MPDKRKELIGALDVARGLVRDLETMIDAGNEMSFNVARIHAYDSLRNIGTLLLGVGMFANVRENQPKPRW